MEASVSSRAIRIIQRAMVGQEKEQGILLGEGSKNVLEEETCLLGTEKCRMTLDTEIRKCGQERE